MEPFLQGSNYLPLPLPRSPHRSPSPSPSSFGGHMATDELPFSLIDLPPEIREKIDDIIEKNEDLESQLDAIDALIFANCPVKCDIGNESGIGSDSDSGNGTIPPESSSSSSQKLRELLENVDDVMTSSAADDIDDFINRLIVPPPPLIPSATNAKKKQEEIDVAHPRKYSPVVFQTNNHSISKNTVSALTSRFENVKPEKITDVKNKNEELTTRPLLSHPHSMSHITITPTTTPTPSPISIITNTPTPPPPPLPLPHQDSFQSSSTEQSSGDGNIDVGLTTIQKRGSQFVVSMDIRNGSWQIPTTSAATTTTSTSARSCNDEEKLNVMPTAFNKETTQKIVNNNNNKEHNLQRDVITGSVSNLDVIRTMTDRTKTSSATSSVAGSGERQLQTSPRNESNNQQQIEIENEKLKRPNQLNLQTNYNNKKIIMPSPSSNFKHQSLNSFEQLVSTPTRYTKRTQAVDTRRKKATRPATEMFSNGSSTTGSMHDIFENGSSEEEEDEIGGRKKMAVSDEDISGLVEMRVKQPTQNKIDPRTLKAHSMLSLYDPSSDNKDKHHKRKWKNKSSTLQAENATKNEGQMKLKPGKLSALRAKFKISKRNSSESSNEHSSMFHRSESAGDKTDSPQTETQRSDYLLTGTFPLPTRSSIPSPSSYINSNDKNNRNNQSPSVPIDIHKVLQRESYGEPDLGIHSRQSSSATFNTFRGEIQPIKWSEEKSRFSFSKTTTQRWSHSLICKTLSDIDQKCNTLSFRYSLPTDITSNGNTSALKQQQQQRLLTTKSSAEAANQTKKRLESQQCKIILDGKQTSTLPIKVTMTSQTHSTSHQPPQHLSVTSVFVGNKETGSDVIRSNTFHRHTSSSPSSVEQSRPTEENHQTNLKPGHQHRKMSSISGGITASTINHAQNHQKMSSVSHGISARSSNSNPHQLNRPHDEPVFRMSVPPAHRSNAAAVAAPPPPPLPPSVDTKKKSIVSMSNAKTTRLIRSEPHFKKAEEAACNRAINDIKTMKNDLNSKKELLSNVGTSVSTISDESFFARKDSLAINSRQLVTDSKLLVGGATRSRTELEQALDNSMRTMNQVFDWCSEIVTVIPSNNLSVRLVDAVQDVASVFLNVVADADLAVGKGQDHPDMVRLMNRAADLARALTNLVMTVKILDNRGP